MIITSEEQYSNLFKSRSRILNRPAPNPKTPPRYFDSMDFSPSGLERLIAERNELLLSYREQVRTAIKEWKAFCKRNLMPQASKPISHYAEKINYTKAKCLCFEAELRDLNAMKQKLLAEAEKNVQAVHRHPKAIVKFKGGVPHLCDGRALLVDAEGDVRFVETKELLSDYRAKIAEAQKLKLGAKRARLHRISEAVLSAREIPPKKARTWRHPG